jgi:hypothetical protein
MNELNLCFSSTCIRGIHVEEFTFCRWFVSYGMNEPTRDRGCVPAHQTDVTCLSAGNNFHPELLWQEEPRNCLVTLEINLERTVNNTPTLGARSEGRQISSGCVFFDISFADPQIHVGLHLVSC